MTAQQALRILTEGAAATALATLTLDARGVSAISCEFGGELPVAGLERASIERVNHGATISPQKASAQADWLR